MTVSLFLTGRHGQPQNNREGPETGRGLWVPRTPLCQRNPVQTSKSLTQRRTYTPLISDTHCTSVQIWLEVDFILLAVCASRANNAKLTRLFRWHSHELHRALTLSLKLHQSAPAVITLAVCWRHVAFSPINATLCLLAQYKCKWLAWKKVWGVWRRVNDDSQYEVRRCSGVKCLMTVSVTVWIWEASTSQWEKACVTKTSRRKYQATSASTPPAFTTGIDFI